LLIAKQKRLRADSGTADALKGRAQGGDLMTNQASILIVDDEEIVRLSYLRILAGTTAKVQAVWNWAQVAQAMQDEPADVVLLDLRMPEMDGITVLKALKQRWPESEVIVITGYPTLETAKQAVSLGAYDYLTKPVNPEQVIHASNAAWLHKRWALHSDRSPPTTAARAAGEGG
jgi:DNA-binding NtrC family response regulator